jgi:TonB family protein
MRLILVESGRSFFQTSECALLSILAHGLLVWSAVSLTTDGRRLPTDQREARVFYLLPPDRVDVRDRQMEVLQWGKLGRDLQDGRYLLKPDGGLVRSQLAHGARGKRHRSGARGQLPFGPAPLYVPDTVFSVIQVDRIVERYPSSAAPVYPEELLASGTEGMVQATYVVDTLGQVDTTTIHVVYSDDPRFTASVVTSLGAARFSPALRQGRHVRQLVEQKFRFKIRPSDGDPVSS